MGRDVVAVLQQIISLYGKRTEDEAEAYVKGMVSQGRLVQELWA